MSIRIGVFCFLLLLCGSCKNRLEKHGELFSDLMKSPDGLFRGTSLGDSPDAVQQTETATPTEISQESITYEIPVAGAGNCKITYNFGNDGLFEILAEANFDHQKDGLDMLYGFRDFFNEKYGPYEKERGNLVWKVKDNGFDTGTVLEMTDESEFTDFGLWSLSIYKTGLVQPESDSLMIN